MFRRKRSGGTGGGGGVRPRTAWAAAVESAGVKTVIDINKLTVECRRRHRDGLFGAALDAVPTSPKGSRVEKKTTKK